MLVAWRISLLFVVLLLLLYVEVASASFLSSSACLVEKSTSRLGLRSIGDASNDKREDKVTALSSQEEQPSPIGLYVHIPYCRRRCRYCNFAIVPIGTNVETDIHHEEVIDSDHLSPQSIGFHHMNQEYTAALLKELQSIRMHRSNGNKEVSLYSIYFGGGTPSLMPIASLRLIFAAIIDGFQIEHGHCEITLEVDPGTFTMEKLQAWKDLGINRLSLGVQSFDDTLLESLGRVHRLQDIYNAVAMMRDVYGEDVNYSIDLISGLPGLSIPMWTETLQIATTKLHPRPKHLSVYDLQIEQGTVFGNLYGNSNNDDDDDDEGKLLPATIRDISMSSKLDLRLPSSHYAAFMYKYTAGYLRSKHFEHYEVSSFAATPSSDPKQCHPSPFRSQHNQIYWGYNTQWFAVGLGATSFVANVTLARPRTMSDYLQWVNTLDEDEGDVISLKPGRDSFLEELESLVLKRLRTSDGLSLKYVETRYGVAYVDAIRKGIQFGSDYNLVSLDEYEDTIRLTDPSGFLFSNSIISSIFYELDALDQKHRILQKQSA